MRYLIAPIALAFALGAAAGAQACPMQQNVRYDQQQLASQEKAQTPIKIPAKQAKQEG